MSGRVVGFVFARGGSKGLPRKNVRPLGGIPLIGHAVPLGVGQFPDAGRCSHIQRAGIPHGSFGKHHVVGEDRSANEMPVFRLEAKDAVRLFLELLLYLFIGTGRIAHIQPALLVEIGGDRPIDQRRPGRQLDLEAHGQREDVAV